MVLVSSWDEEMNIKLAEHYKFSENGVNFLTLIEYACIFEQRMFGYLVHMKEFRDEYGDKQKELTKINFF